MEFAPALMPSHCFRDGKAAQSSSRPNPGTQMTDFPKIAGGPDLRAGHAIPQV
jgi:hypothetical protein